MSEPASRSEYLVLSRGQWDPELSRENRPVGEGAPDLGDEPGSDEQERGP